MIDKLEQIKKKFKQIEIEISNPDIVKNKLKYQKYLKEHKSLLKIVETYEKYKNNIASLEEAKEILKDNDKEMQELAREEISILDKKNKELKKTIKKLLVPKDPNDSKNAIVEIRAGTGGDEAALFASDLFRMYVKYAENKSFKMEVMDSHPIGIGGFKEVVVMFKGDNAYGEFRYESGTHRVQRVPTTETQGRIHTSAVTVAVLPEATDVEINIDPSDIKTDVYRATGPGGQSVNTTDSAVRLTHIPTGTVATCQDQKSQLKNKIKAMRVLKARIFDKIVREQEAKRSADRKEQVGTGDRSGRIRTYNFPQGRVTDHRIGLTLYKLETILEGRVDLIIDELKTFYQAKKIGEF